MEFEDKQLNLFKAIDEHIKRAPTNWAKLIGSEMGYKETTIRNIARGFRGRRTKKPITLLRLLKKLIAEQDKQINDAIGDNNEN